MARPLIETTFAIYGCLVTTSTLMKKRNFPWTCLMLFTLLQAKIYLDCTEGTRGSTLEQEIAPPGLYWRGLRIHPRMGEADASLC